MARLHEICPDAESLLALEPEELAGVILEHLHSLGQDDRGDLHRSNYVSNHTVREFTPESHDELLRALMEAQGQP